MAKWVCEISIYVTEYSRDGHLALDANCAFVACFVVVVERISPCSALSALHLFLCHICLSFITPQWLHDPQERESRQRRAYSSPSW